MRERKKEGSRWGEQEVTGDGEGGADKERESQRGTETHPRERRCGNKIGEPEKKQKSMEGKSRRGSEGKGGVGETQGSKTEEEREGRGPGEEGGTPGRG